MSTGGAVSLAGCNRKASTGLSRDKPYQNALFALDAERLFAEISKAEAIIRRRRAELLQESADGDELVAIATGLQVLSQPREIEHKRQPLVKA